MSRRAMRYLVGGLAVAVALTASSGGAVYATPTDPDPGPGTSVAAAVGGPPAAPSNLQVTPTGAQVGLTWTDNSADETGFDVERARYVAGTWTEWTSFAVGANVTAAAQSNVPDGQYAYLVRSTNANGPSAWVVATTTVSTATTPPSPPTSLVATPNASTVQLSWLDASNNELGFDVMRARNVAGVWSEWTGFVADINAAGFTDMGVSDGFYAYLVRSHNVLGNSAWTITTVTVSTASAAPNAPTGLTISTTGGQVSLTWTDQSANETGFDIERARYVAGAWSEWTGFPVDRNATSAGQTGVADGQYAYLIRARNAVGVSAWVIAVIDVSSATSPPPPPTSVTASATGAAVTLSWVDQASGATGETRYDIQRAQNVSGQWTNWVSFVADKNATTFVDPSVANGVYAYLVRAYNPLGPSVWTTTQITVTTGPPTTGPHAFLFPIANGGYARWNPCSTIHYVVNDDLVDAAHRTVLDAAIAEIKAQTGLDFVYGGETTTTGQVPPTGQEVILSFANGPLNGSATTLGFGGGYYYSTGRIFNGFIIIRSDIAATTTLRAVILHELGHMVGLNHVNDPTQLMNPYITSLSEYQNGDREGLWWEGAAQGCSAFGGLNRAADGPPLFAAAADER